MPEAKLVIIYFELPDKATRELGAAVKKLGETKFPDMEFIITNAKLHTIPIAELRKVLAEIAAK